MSTGRGGASTGSNFSVAYLLDKYLSVPVYIFVEYSLCRYLHNCLISTEFMGTRKYLQTNKKIFNNIF